MREIFLVVHGDGTIQASDNWLGFSGEHNATTVYADISANELLMSADYCRFVFDNYLSEALTVTDGKDLGFSLPQCVMEPPTVNCQICGYVKTSDGEFSFIGKSDRVTFTVSPSEIGGSEASRYASDNFEKAVGECEVLSQSAKESEGNCKHVLAECESTRYQTEDLLKRCEEHYYATISAASSAEKYESGAEEAAQRADGSAILAKQYSELAAVKSESAEQALSEIRELVDGYYTKEEADDLLSAKADKQTDFELISSVNVDGTESTITFGKDSGDNEFRLTDACVKIKIPKSTTTANLSVIANPSASNNSWLDRVVVTNAIQSSADNKFIVARFRFEGGFVFGEAASGNVSGGSMSTHFSSYGTTLIESDRGKKIGAITLSSSEKIPSGSLIEVWGRR